MTNKALEILVWILIYGGLLLLCLGLFVLRGHASWGWTGVAAGAGITAAGVVLLWLRALRDR